MRTMLKKLAADGHTVFVFSHLMSEMAQTPTRLVVIGPGRLIAGRRGRSGMGTSMRRPCGPG